MSLGKSGRMQDTPNSMSEALSPIHSNVEEGLRDRFSQLEQMCGGRIRLTEALLASGHPEAKRFAVQLAKRANDSLSLWDLLHKTRTSPEELLRLYKEGDLVWSTVEAIKVLSDGLPSLMQESIKVATTAGADGFRDRELLFKMAGLTKDVGGVHVNLNQSISQHVGQFEPLVGGASRFVQSNPFEDEVIDVQAEESKDVQL